MSSQPNDHNKPVFPIIIWGLVTILFVYQFIARSSFPTVLADKFMTHFQIDATGVGVLASCYYWVYTLMQVPAGLILDKFSCRVMAFGSASACALGVLLFTLSHSCVLAGFGQMLLGFGSSFVFLLALKVISDCFPTNEIPLKISYTIAFGSAGPVVGGLLVSSLIKDYDWIDIMRTFAVLGIFLAVTFWFYMDDHKKSSDDSIDDQDAANKVQTISIMDALKMIITSRQAWILSLFTMMLYAPLSALGDLWGVSFIKKAYGVDSTVASLANNMLYVGLIFGSPLFAYLSVLWNSYKKPMILGMSLAAFSIGLVAFCSGLPLEAAFFLFFLTGLSCGAMLTYTLALVIFPPSIGATVSGFVNMMSMGSGIILMPLMGYIINLSWDGTIENGVKVYSVQDFRHGLMSVLAFLIIGVILSFMIEDRSPKEKRKGT